MKQLLIGTVLCVFVFAACDATVSGTVPVDDISGSNNDDPNINPTIDPPTIDPPTIDPPTIDPQTIALWAFPVVTKLWEPGEYTDDEGISVTDAYPIDNWRQLQFISENFKTNADLLEHTYYLTADITFPSRDIATVPETNKDDPYVTDGWIPIGDYYYDDSNTFVEAFTGNFDGQGHTISNIHIIQNVHSENGGQIGFFGGIGGFNASQNGITPLIHDITFRDAHVTGSSENSGILAGYIQHSDIKNVTIENGFIQGAGNTGGLIGSSRQSTISHSSSSAVVTGDYSVGGLIGYGVSISVKSNYATGNVTGTNINVGGVIGQAQYSKIENNYALGTVNSTSSRIGGLVGHSDSSTLNTNYSRSKVSGIESIGGLAGRAFSSTLTNNFWDVSANSGIPPSGSYPIYGVGNLGSDDGAAPLTPTTADDFVGFVFSTTEGWNTPADGAWPTLYWQEEN